MPRPKRAIRYGMLGLLAISLVACGLLDFPPYYQTEQTIPDLQALEEYGERDVDVEGKNIHLVYSGRADAPLVIFIHGSPGSWDAWADYLLDEELRARAFMVAIDRAGFGGSDDGTHEPDLQTHANQAVQAALQAFPQKKSFVVVGHSYGGPVALRIAVDFPQQTRAAILLAPSIDPELEEHRWYNILSSYALVRAILPDAVDRSNQEILPLKPELVEMHARLAEVRAPVIVIQGEKDTLVPPGNADYAQRELVNAPTEIIRITERGHFIPWEEYGRVKATLLKQLK